MTDSKKKTFVQNLFLKSYLAHREQKQTKDEALDSAEKFVKLALAGKPEFVFIHAGIEEIREGKEVLI